MSLIKRLIRASLAGFFLALYKSTQNRRWLDVSVRLHGNDPDAIRETLIVQGYDPQWVNRYLLAPEFLGNLTCQDIEWFQSHYSESRAQLFQDLFVLYVLGRKSKGYFVEVGVGDGNYLSNTWLLEKRYNWTGILAEPNPILAPQVRAVRDAVVDKRAVWSRSGESLEFLDVPDCRELSTLARFRQSDTHQRAGIASLVETITLDDLLKFHAAPDVIDYMSIDTEGSEWDVLQGLDFSRWKISLFTIEHNYDAAKLAKITELLASHGYIRVMTGFARFDAWYVHGDTLSAMSGHLQNCMWYRVAMGAGS